MKKQPQDQRDWHERKDDENRGPAEAQVPQPTSDMNALMGAQGPIRVIPPSGEQISESAMKPGKVGLANEARPGLGTRADDPDPAAAPAADEARAKPKPAPQSGNELGETERGYEEPPPEPREQAPDSLAHEQERQTGVSGHSSGT